MAAKSEPAPADTNAAPSRPHDNQRLTFAYEPIEGIRANPRDPRRYSRNEVRRVIRMVKALGPVPLVVTSAGEVVNGSIWLEAAIGAGLSQVPVLRADYLSPAEADALMLASARLVENGKWDDQKVGQILLELTQATNLDFAVDVTGFDIGEIDLRIEALGAGPVAAGEPTIPAVEAAAVSRPGDVWVMGRHKLMCADACDPATYRTLFGYERATALFCDPPFNVKIEGHVSGLGKHHHREFVQASGEMSPDEFTDFLSRFLVGPIDWCMPGAVGFVFMDWRHLPELLDATRSLHLELMNLCVWTKPQPGMGSLYRSQHELCLVLKLSAGRHRNNVQLGTYGRSRSNVWPYAAGPGFGRAGEEGNLASLHPTVKPVALVADALLDVTARGDIVLDPFLGSGTTLLAAERVGRRCFGSELDPLYCDVIVRRWQAFTGDSASLLATGATFAEVAATRLAPAANPSAARAP